MINLPALCKIYNGALLLLISFFYALEVCNYSTSAVLILFYACCMRFSCTPGKGLCCIDLFKYVVNHPGAHGEKETKGTVTLLKLTSAKLQKQLALQHLKHCKREEQGSGLQNSQKLYSVG